jgi:hypothetical protein
MNASAYFETDPWTETVQIVRRGSLGPLAAIAVQVTCPPGALDTVVEAWERRWESLLGAPIGMDKQHAEGVVSLLARYSGNIIVRLFADEGTDGPVSNFEIVGTEGLLIWKPDVHPLARLRLSGRDEIAFAHPYAASLAQEAAL